MTLPTPQEARSRQTAIEAERHFWTSRLVRIANVYRMEAHFHRAHNGETGGVAARVYDIAANELDALIAERAR